MSSFDSPGGATRERARVEREALRVLTPIVGMFLSDVRRLALHGASSSTPFSAATVAAHWEVALGDATPALARALPGYDTAPIIEDLLHSTIPDSAYTSARTVLETAGAEQWSATRLERSLGEVLSPTRGGPIPTPPPGVELPRTSTGLTDYGTIARSGSGWNAVVTRQVRTQATAAAARTNLEGILDARLPYKQWVSRHDAKTRPSHMEADGQIVSVSGYFEVGGDRLRYPGDPLGSPEEIANCRCIVVSANRR